MRYLKHSDKKYVVLSQIISAIIGLASGKLIALYVSPKEFGEYNIQFAAYTFFSTLLLSPFLQFSKSTIRTLQKRIGSKYYLYLGVGISIIVFILLKIFYTMYYGEWNPYIAAFFLLFIPLTLLSSTVSDFLMVNNKLLDFSKLTVIKSAVGLLFILCCFHFGATLFKGQEALWGMQLISVVFCIVLFSRKYKFYLSTYKISLINFIKKYFSFTWPLIFLAIWSWINNYFDRYAIDYFLSTQDVGIYNANYGVGSKFFLLLSPIIMALISPFVYDKLSIDEKKHKISSYVQGYLFLGIIILSGIYISKNLIGEVLLSSLYQGGFNLIFWTALAFFILTTTHIYESLFYAEHKTNIILIGNIIAAIFNVALNIVLIPEFGIFGAALATCIGFFVQFIIIYFFYRRA
ncbi:hypothetical protein PKOR_00730 [Pontibacter korlensis]|uniref:Uncharacterized protein n=1 Tax=Pontibacter korlensis TaxID=400092 RepID=A0A0E3ZCL8_9BACT|nr:hypothetical protein PKOR_00730 [Pontibacter korlensis]